MDSPPPNDVTSKRKAAFTRHERNALPMDVLIDLAIRAGYVVQSQSGSPPTLAPTCASSQSSQIGGPCAAKICGGSDLELQLK